MSAHGAESTSPARDRKRPFRAVLAAAMIAVGILHFVNPGPFIKIVPAYLPAHAALVYVSGLFEVLGGAGLLVPRVRKLAAWGLVALYLSVFPANLYQAMNHVSFEDGHPIPQLALWLRLPLQIPLIGLAIWLAADDPRRRSV